jgi:hypothetical protein
MVERLPKARHRIASDMADVYYLKDFYDQTNAQGR